MYQELTSLGRFYRLDIRFDYGKLKEELAGVADGWRQYNLNKPSIQRKGLSLFSLDGEIDGQIDLNSIREYNQGRPDSEKLNEMSFRTPTKFWRALTSLSKPLGELEPYLGRSHLIKFGEGGFFPSHRDLGDSFRLISFFNCYNDSFFTILDGHRVDYERDVLYFMDTRLIHSLFSTASDAMILVLNVELSDPAKNFVLKHLQEK